MKKERSQREILTKFLAIAFMLAIAVVALIWVPYDIGEPENSTVDVDTLIPAAPATEKTSDILLSEVPPKSREYQSGGRVERLAEPGSASDHGANISCSDLSEIKTIYERFQSLSFVDTGGTDNKMIRYMELDELDLVRRVEGGDPYAFQENIRRKVQKLFGSTDGYYDKRDAQAEVEPLLQRGFAMGSIELSIQKKMLEASLAGAAGRDQYEEEFNRHAVEARAWDLFYFYNSVHSYSGSTAIWSALASRHGFDFDEFDFIAKSEVRFDELMLYVNMLRHGNGLGNVDFGKRNQIESEMNAIEEKIRSESDVIVKDNDEAELIFEVRLFECGVNIKFDS